MTLESELRRYSLARYRRAFVEQGEINSFSSCHESVTYTKNQSVKLCLLRTPRLMVSMSTFLWFGPRRLEPRWIGGVVARELVAVNKSSDIL